MSQRANEMGQGEQTLSRAAGLVAEAKHDFASVSRRLDAQISGLRGRWVGAGGAAFFALHTAWAEKQAVVVGALDDFAQALVVAERDNLRTDETQSVTYARTTARLG